MTFAEWWSRHFGAFRYPAPGILFFADGTWPYIRVGWHSYVGYTELVNFAALTLPG